MSKFGGKAARQELAKEIDKLGKIKDDDAAFSKQNAKVAAAEKQVNALERAHVRTWMTV